MIEMFELLFAMLKEEYRIHTSFFNRRLFFLYPAVILIITYVLSIFVLQISQNVYLLGVAAHFVLFIYGVSVGVFGLHAKEALSVRFDHLSLLLYSSRTLPVSSKTILVTFAVHDMIYYFFLTILPMVLGIALVMPSLGVSIYNVSLVLLTFTLTFLYGLSMSFFITMLYSVFRKAFLILFVVASYLAFIYYGAWFNVETISSILLPISLLSGFRLDTFLMSLIVPIGLILFSLLLLRDEPKADTRRGWNLFLPVHDAMLNVSKKYSSFVAKDMVDMQRTNGGISKVLFTYLIPAALVWVMMDLFSTAFFVLNNTVLSFAIIVGVISTGIYNWLNQYDSLGNYRILPVDVRAVIVSKVISYLLISSMASTVIIISVSIVSGGLQLLPLSMFLMFSVSFYVLSVLVYIAGLQPNIILYDARAFVRYFMYSLPVLIPLMTASFFEVELVIGHIILMCVATLFMSRIIFLAALKKWSVA